MVDIEVKRFADLMAEDLGKDYERTVNAMMINACGVPQHILDRMGNHMLGWPHCKCLGCVLEASATGKLGKKG